MKRKKPDILWVLVILFSLGMVTTGYTSYRWELNDELVMSAAER